MKAHHTMSQFVQQLTPGTVFFVYVLVAAAIITWTLFTRLTNFETCCTFPMKIENFNLSQKVANFFEAMRTRDRKSIIRETVLDFQRLNAPKFSKE